jgi:ribulose-5-phosphate 4-epimerase/fuculose-1-phosphate aldolase
MGHQVPVYDIDSHYTSSDNLHSLLVTNEHLGAGLAAGFNPSSSISKGVTALKNYLTSSPPVEVDFPPSPTVLMRGHGMTVIGTSIEEAVYRSIFTCTNARVQTTALLMQGGYNLGLVAKRMGQGGGEKGENPGPAKHEGIHFLSERESKDAWTQNQGHAERPWKLWCREVKELGLYANELGDPPGA